MEATRPTRLPTKRPRRHGPHAGHAPETGGGPDADRVQGTRTRSGLTKMPGRRRRCLLDCDGVAETARRRRERRLRTPGPVHTPPPQPPMLPGPRSGSRLPRPVGAAPSTPCRSAMSRAPPAARLDHRETDAAAPGIPCQSPDGRSITSLASKPAPMLSHDDHCDSPPKGWLASCPLQARPRSQCACLFALLKLLTNASLSLKT